MGLLTKDTMYDLIKEPNRENFRLFVQELTGEHNEIDFKATWIEGSKLAKEMIAIANSGGGIILVGLFEKDDGTIETPGLEKLEDKADISNMVEKYISPNLGYTVYDFSFESSEYEALRGRKYQMMYIEDRPQFIPYLPLRRSEHLRQNAIYVRRGTKCVEATTEDIESMIQRRLNYSFPQTGKPLTLDEHFDQLMVLYSRIEPNIRVRVSDDKPTALATAFRTFGERLQESFAPMLEQVVGKYETVPNPIYPEEKYDEFVARMITEKKKKIERVLDLH